MEEITYTEYLEYHIIWLTMHKSVPFPSFRFLLVFSLHVRRTNVHHQIPSTTVPQAQHSTAHSTRTSSKESTCRSQRDNADKQTELARASMSSSIYTYIQLARCVLKTNELFFFSFFFFLGLQKYPTIHKAA